jgi:CheY-like chemotaxis protein
VVDNNTDLDRELSHFFANTELEIVKVDGPEAARAAVREEPADAVVLVPEIKDSTLAALAEQLLVEPHSDQQQVFLFLSDDANPDDAARWKQVAHEFSLHTTESLPQLTNCLVRAACLPERKLSEPCRALLSEDNGLATNFAGKKVMIVDDDIRNIFALTSVLERFDFVTVSAETGRDAINLLQAAPDVDIVLMDIMMPEMDGIDTMRAIRRIAHFKKLPIIAVTAKAMKGDREKCIDAGAWDYLSKPVNPEQLLAVLRAWLTV